MANKFTSPFPLSKKQLHDLYVVKKMSQSAIAEKYGIGQTSVSRHLKEYGIKAGYNGDRSGKNNPNWKGIADTPCDNCGKPIGKAVADRGVGNKNYCGRKCYGEHRTKLGTLTVVCPICKKSFVLNKHDSGKRKFCSIQCAGKDPSESQRKSKTHKGKTIPEWHKQAVSKAVTARSAEKEFSYGKSGHHVSTKAGNIFYRSSYEKIAYEMLDANKNVASYQPEPFVITYLNSDGRTRRYRPDILVNKVRGKAVLVEVKPKWKLADTATILKLEAGKNYAKQRGLKFEVWTEKELGIK